MGGPGLCSYSWFEFTTGSHGSFEIIKIRQDLFLTDGPRSASMIRVDTADRWSAGLEDRAAAGIAVSFFVQARTVVGSLKTVSY